VKTYLHTVLCKYASGSRRLNVNQMLLDCKKWHGWTCQAQIVSLPFGESSPIRGLDRPRGFQEIKVPILRDKGTGWW